jgi:hypothetical protein
VETPEEINGLLEVGSKSSASKHNSHHSKNTSKTWSGKKT